LSIQFNGLDIQFDGLDVQSTQSQIGRPKYQKWMPI
jgi:hypothetical protein